MIIRYNVYNVLVLSTLFKNPCHCFSDPVHTGIFPFDFKGKQISPQRSHNFLFLMCSKLIYCYRQTPVIALSRF